jgi:hypothetical protein
LLILSLFVVVVFEEKLLNNRSGPESSDRLTGAKKGVFGQCPAKVFATAKTI